MVKEGDMRVVGVWVEVRIVDGRIFAMLGDKVDGECRITPSS